MKDRKQLEKFIVDKLNEIRAEFVDYVSQYAELKVAWDNNDIRICMAASVGDVSGFSMFEPDKDNYTYVVNISGKFGSLVGSEISEYYENREGEEDERNNNAEV